MAETAMGQIGIPPREFWMMTPYEFLCAQKGFYDLYRAKEKEEWRRTIQLINIQLPAKDRIDAEKVLSEHKTIEKKPPKSLDEMKRLADKLSKISNWKPYNGAGIP